MWEYTGEYTSHVGVYQEYTSHVGVYWEYTSHVGVYQGVY